MNRLQQIEARLAEIRGLVDAPDADLDALETEVTSLEEERAQLLAAAEQRSALVARVAGAVGGRPIHPVPSPLSGAEGASEEREFDASSPEYRSAYLKTLAKDQKTGEMRLGELTDVEQRAFTFTTATTASVIPTQMSNKIWDMVATRYAILNHIAKSTFNNVYQFEQATAITAGDAAVTSENVANSDDMTITFNPVTLTGSEVKADVVISRKMQIQSMDGFEDYLVRKIAERIGVQLNTLVFTAIDADTTIANVETAGALEITDFRSALGAIRGGYDCRIYANQTTIWNEIAAVEDTNGRAYFIASEKDDDPTLQGRIYGKPVYLDDTLADDVIKIGYVDAIEANLFQDVDILSDVDVKTHGTTYGGYALFEAALGDTRSWVTISITDVVS